MKREFDGQIVKLVKHLEAQKEDMQTNNERKIEMLK